MNIDYRADIDGLRAIAVILVLIFHAFPAALPGGYVGVDVFFVISGYVITRKYYPEILNRQFSYRSFYAARTRRLLPALSIVTLSTLAIGSFILLPFKYESLGLQAVAGSFFFPNILAWSQAGYFDPVAETKPLLHLWSLGVEEQFYIVWPVLLIAVSKRPRLATAALISVALTSLAICVYSTTHLPVSSYYLPFSRLWELAAGGILAIAGTTQGGRRFPPLLGMGLILASAFAFDKTSPFPGWRAIVPVAGTCLVIAYGLQLLSHEIFVKIGKISYPVYLWHWPLLTFAFVTENRAPATLIAILMASLVLGWITAQLVERPFRFRMPRAIGTISAASLSVVTGIAGLAVWTSAGVPQRFSPAIQSVLANMRFNPGSNARVLKCWLESGSLVDFAPECSVGKTVVWGDSHAARLYAGMSTASSEPIAQFTRDACLPSFDLADTVCDRSNTAIVRRIVDLKPDRVVIFAYWSNPAFTDSSNAKRLESLRTAILEIKRVVPTVVLIGPAPVWSPDLVSQLYANWNSTGVIADRLRPEPRNYAAIDRSLSDVAQATGATFKSVSERLCTTAGCLTQTDDKERDLLSFDYGHLTTSGAQFVARELGL